MFPIPVTCIYYLCYYIQLVGGSWDGAGAALACVRDCDRGVREDDDCSDDTTPATTLAIVLASKVGARASFAITRDSRTALSNLSACARADDECLTTDLFTKSSDVFTKSSDGFTKSSALFIKSSCRCTKSSDGFTKSSAFFTKSSC